MVNWQRSKKTVIAAILVTLSCLCCCAFGSLSLRNYDNDPNMAKAMEYDLGENHHDYEKADRAMAEKYYLEYLKNVQESFQKARVYAHLGALYATGFDVRKGEKADYSKARYYFHKVLELEPTRIARPTIQARTMLASIDKFGSDRVRADMDVYEWLRSIDEEKMNKLWLPLTPDDEGPSELIIRSTKNLQKSLYSTLETNIIAVIKHIPDSATESHLLEIVQRFAGTELDKLARKHAAERGIPLTGMPSIKAAEPEMPMAKAGEPEMPTTKPREEVEKPREETIPEEAAHPAWAYRLPAGIIGIGVLTALAAVVLLKRKPTSPGK